MRPLTRGQQKTEREKLATDLRREAFRVEGRGKLGAVLAPLMRRSADLVEGKKPSVDIPAAPDGLSAAETYVVEGLRSLLFMYQRPHRDGTETHNVIGRATLKAAVALVPPGYWMTEQDRAELNSVYASLTREELSDFPRSVDRLAEVSAVIAAEHAVDVRLGIERLEALANPPRRGGLEL